MSTFEDDSQKAFMAFMLGSNRQPAEVYSAAGSSPTRGNTAKQQTRRHHALVKAFQQALTSWLSVDDQLLLVVGSIENLRRRCYLTNRMLVEESSNDENLFDSRPSWKECGYRSCNVHNTLPSDSLQDTLTDELLQHEKMSTAARRLMSQLSAEQDAVGRRLDDLLVFHVDHSLAIDNPCCDSHSGTLRAKMHETVEECQHLFLAAASEVFRKQLLVQQLLDSTNDSLLYNQQDDNSSGPWKRDKDARRTARKCADQWPRTSVSSPLFPYRHLLESILTRNS